jgi:hypothetical protein
MPFLDYAPRFPLPEFLVRAQDNDIEAAIYRDGAISAPTSGTVTIYDEAGTKVVDGAAITVASSKATYTVTAATLPDTKGLSDLWQIRWALVMSDGQTYTFIREAHLVRLRLYPVISDSDLEAMHGDLSRWKARTGGNLQGYIDEAWTQLQTALLQMGRRPWLVLSSSALRSPHLYLALSLVFRDFATSAGNGRFGELSEDYHRMYEQAFGTLSIRYDSDETGLPSSDEVESAAGVVFLGGPGSSTWNYTWPV